MLRELKKVVEESGKDMQEFQQAANYLLAHSVCQCLINMDNVNISC